MKGLQWKRIVAFLSVFKKAGKRDRRMPETVTLRRNMDFKRLYRKKPLVSSVLVAYVGKNRLGVCRVGITTGKKIGKAHERNRARRVIREAYRLLSDRLPEQGGLDFVFVARKRATVCKMQDAARAMEKALSPYLDKKAP